MRNGRGLGAYVHVDVLFEAYFNACLVLVDQGAPLDPNNPYLAREIRLASARSARRI